MHFWLVYPHGGLPGEGLRPDRPAMIAEALAAAGHRVTWWASGFSHRTKRHRTATPLVIDVSDRVRIVVVPTTGYENHISWARIRSEQNYARGVIALARTQRAPDVVVLSEPSLFFGRAALRTVRLFGAKLILDTIDLWPELFHITLPMRIRPLGRVVFAPLYARRARTYARADGVIAVSDDYAALSRRLARHLPHDRVRTVYYGVHLAQFRASMLADGPIPPPVAAHRTDGELRLIFASTLGNNYDITTILASSQILARRGIRHRLFVAGTGPLESMVARASSGTASSSVCYLGNPDADTMARVYAHCDIGISAYVNGSSVTMPIKAFHYFAAGLAVVNSLDGELRWLLDTTGAGQQFAPEDPVALAMAVETFATTPGLLASTRAASLRLGVRFDTAVQYAGIVDLAEAIGVPRVALAESSVSEAHTPTTHD